MQEKFLLFSLLLSFFFASSLIEEEPPLGLKTRQTGLKIIFPTSEKDKRIGTMKKLYSFLYRKRKN